MQLIRTLGGINRRAVRPQKTGDGSIRTFKGRYLTTAPYQNLSEFQKIGAGAPPFARLPQARLTDARMSYCAHLPAAAYHLASAGATMRYNVRVR